MSQYREWAIYGKHPDGTPLTNHEVDEFYKLSDYLSDLELDIGKELFCFGATESAFASDYIGIAIKQFVTLHPEIEIKAFFKDECDSCPYGFYSPSGTDEVNLLHSKLIFYDELGRVYEDWECGI